MKKKWTEADLTDLGETAIANALDEADGEPDNLRTFESELEFQLAAPENRERRSLKPEEIAIVRKIWDHELRRFQDPEYDFSEQEAAG